MTWRPGDPENPRLIVEVLSHSTPARDRGVKLPDYRHLPSVQQILLVSGLEGPGEAGRRTADGRRCSDPIGDAAVVLAAIYDGVAL